MRVREGAAGCPTSAMAAAGRMRGGSLRGGAAYVVNIDVGLEHAPVRDESEDIGKSQRVVQPDVLCRSGGAGSTRGPQGRVRLPRTGAKGDRARGADATCAERRCDLRGALGPAGAYVKFCGTFKEIAGQQCALDMLTVQC